MRAIDWVVLFGWLTFLVSYGLYRGRGSDDVNKYLLAGRSMPWYAMGLSILATQASAITFISTTGQGYVDGLRFAQFYFGLPIAMILISMTAVPIFRRANVYTAYEYLERRFDAKTRSLVSVIFLIQRGLAAGIGLYAPAVALSAILGWPDRITTFLIGSLIVVYTTAGGIKALTWADVQQMTMIFVALTLSLIVAIHMLPHNVSLPDALQLAGATDRLQIVDLKFDLSNRYNVWSGLIGGAFLALAYFGCDQSQVQRYLTGRSISESRFSLLFNAVVKIPMQLFILFIGVVVFAVSLFVPTPAIFHPAEARRAAKTEAWKGVESEYHKAFEGRKAEAYRFIASRQNGHSINRGDVTELRKSVSKFNDARQHALALVEKLNGGAKFDDTNYIFLNFVMTYLPAGLVGLVIGVIFSASMGSTSGEINSLATVSVIDIYQRHVARNRSDRHYLLVSRLLTVFWTAYAAGFAAFGSRGFGALIERVNIVGSLFYGGLLGAFVLAFFFKSVRGTAAFWGVLAGEAAIFSVAKWSNLSFLWYNVVGCVVVVGTAFAITLLRPSAEPQPAS